MAKYYWNDAEDAVMLMYFKELNIKKLKFMDGRKNLTLFQKSSRAAGHILRDAIATSRAMSHINHSWLLLGDLKAVQTSSIPNIVQFRWHVSTLLLFHNK